MKRTAHHFPVRGAEAVKVEWRRFADAD